MKAIVFSRDKVIKIRYNDIELSDLLKELHKISSMEIKERGYTG